MRDSDPARLKLDIIGDVHGQLGALRRLGTELGYVVDGNWSHPEGRRPVFIDFNGVTRAGSYRYPEEEVVWST
jgi:hypothetical protein